MKISDKEINNLLRRYLAGNTTDYENHIIEQWYNELNSYKDVHSFADSITEKQTRNVIYNQLIASLKDGDKKPAIRFTKRTILRVAASVSIIVLLSLIATSIFNKKKHSIAPTAMASTITYGGKKATLIFANGQSIELNTKKNGIVYTNKGVSIIKGDTSIVIKNSNEGDTDNLGLYYTLVTPKGGEYGITLPDGSKVWLNSATTIKFPGRFNQQNRKIHIEGEAFFDVTHNVKKPFIVSVDGKQDIIVHGTMFNVSAYKEVNKVITTLVKGKIEVKAKGIAKSMMLSPGEQCIYSDASISYSIKKEKVDVEPETSWKNGYFVFRQSKLTDIMQQLSRWYNVNIILADVLKDETFTGTIPRNTPVPNLISTFEKTNMLNFRIAGDNIYVDKKADATNN